MEHQRLFHIWIVIFYLSGALILKHFRLRWEMRHGINLSWVIVFLHGSTKQKKLVLVYEASKMTIWARWSALGFKLLPFCVVHVVLYILQRYSPKRIVHAFLQILTTKDI